MDIKKKDVINLGWVVAGGILLYWGLEKYTILFKTISFLFGLLAPLILGGCIAFIINVPMSAIERLLFKNTPKKGADQLRKYKRPISLILTIVLMVFVVTTVIFVVVPEIVRTFGVITENFPSYMAECEKHFQSLMVNIPPQISDWLESLEMDWGNIASKFIDVLKNGATSFLGSTLNIANSVFSGIINCVLACIFSIYMLLQKEKLSMQFKKILYAYISEKRADRIMYVLGLSKKIFTSFITGQCLEACILGAMFFVTMLILRLPYAMLIAVVIAFSALIPIVGAFFGCAVGIFLIVFTEPYKALIFITLFLILQQIEGNLIYPKVVGSSVGLPALWVLMAVTIGGSTLGVVGMVIMVPLCSVIYALLREDVGKRLLEKNVPKDKIEKNTNNT